MSAIVVAAPGLFTTVQDLGREGFGPMGVSPSGAADAISLRLGNRLVGNADSGAALEMTLIGGAFEFPEGGAIALAGSDFGAVLDDAPVELWTSVEVRPGQTLRIGPTRNGARCYLCIQGGIVVEPFLGSSSTHVLSGLGGWHGRALRKGDVLDAGARGVSFRKKVIAPGALDRLAPRKVLRVTAGPQSSRFAKSAQDLFYETVYCVAEASNRVGIRLDGSPIPAPSGGEMITEGVSLGAIQVPPGGRPIVVFVEQQTTGGYPKIANVISADFHSVGQLRPRDEIRFEKVALETARSLLKEQEDLLASRGLIRE